MTPVGEQILLTDAVVRAVAAEGIAVRICLLKDPADPDVPREGVQLMQAEQGDAGGDLAPDSPDLHQGLNGFLTIRAPQVLPADPSGRDSLRRGADICGAVPEFAGVQRLIAQRGYAFGRGKGA